MALVVVHPFVSPVVDDAEPGVAGPDEWNAAHTVTGVLDDANFPPVPPPGYGGAAGPEGPQGEPGDDGGSSNVWLYRAKVTGTTGNPGAGFVIWNNVTQVSATTLRVSATTDNAVDIEAFFGLVMVGDRLLIQQRNASENFQRWDTTGLPVIVNPHTVNAYADIPVALFSSGGTGTTNFAGNLAILLAIIATGPAGAQGPQGPAGGGFPAPTVDGTATGATCSDFNAGYATAVGDLVYLDAAATWQKTDANTLYDGMPGIALEVKTAGQALEVALPGATVYSTAFPTFTIGAPVYMSETAGVLTQTKPTATDSATRVMGWAIHADKLFFYPSPDYITHT